jgi:hypothetical protein
MQTARDLTQNTNFGSTNMANARIGRSDALASGILGQQAGKSQMWSGGAQLGMGLGQGILGGNFFGGNAAPPTMPNTQLPMQNLGPQIYSGPQIYNPLPAAGGSGGYGYADFT